MMRVLQRHHGANKPAGSARQVRGALQHRRSNLFYYFLFAGSA
ncbi:MAG: hypothetical protein ACM3U2_22495 [Deltaproteobacteria bacterium]